MIHRHADDRLHPRQSAPLGSGWKRGEKKQAVGRSRGGRNTKIHALADAKGRLIAILLTGGEAHDYPAAKRLIRRVKPPKHMLGDTAYDGDGLREELDQLGTKPVIASTGSRASEPAARALAETTAVAALGLLGATTFGAATPGAGGQPDDADSKPSHRKHLLSFNKRRYKLRWRIESAFNRLKDFRRIATRYDRLARNYLASVCLAASLVWWI